MTPYFFLLAGLVLILLEFYLPGMIMGISVAFLVLISIIIFAAKTHSTLAVILYMIGVLASVGLLVRFALKHIRSTAKNKTIYLESDQTGFVASAFPEGMVGKTGIALTDLKPSGHALLAGQRCQVLSESGYITAGTEIQAIRGQGAHLVVKPKETKT